MSVAESAVSNFFAPGETIVSPIILVGPTTTGKSSIAKIVAEQTGASILNSDRLYTYARDGLSLGLGLEPGELDDGVERRMYGIRDPHEDPLDVDVYLERAIEVIDKNTEQGVTTIVDGCTRRYNAELYNHYGPAHTVRVSWQNRNDLPVRVDKRMRGIIDQGLYGETARAIENGYELTFPMTSILYTLARGVYHTPRNERRYIHAAKREWLEVALRHDDWYEKNTTATRIDRAANSSNHALATTVVNLMAERVARRAA